MCCVFIWCTPGSAGRSAAASEDVTRECLGHAGSRCGASRGSKTALGAAPIGVRDAEGEASRSGGARRKRTAGESQEPRVMCLGTSNAQPDDPGCPLATRTCLPGASHARARSHTARGGGVCSSHDDVADTSLPHPHTMVVASAEPLLDALEAEDDGRAFLALAARNVRPGRLPPLCWRAEPAFCCSPPPQASRGDSYSFEELAQAMNKKQKPRLCAGLLATVCPPPQLSRVVEASCRAHLCCCDAVAGGVCCPGAAGAPA